MFSLRTQKKKLVSSYIKTKVAKNKVWFVDVPRTSSTIIKQDLAKQLSPVYGKSVLSKWSKYFSITPPVHMTANQCIEYFGKEYWDTFYTFAFTRNPFERMFSWWLFRKNITKDIPSELPFSEYIKRQLVKRKDKLLYAHRVSDYVLGYDDKLAVNYVARYEDREKELRKIEQCLKQLGMNLSFSGKRMYQANFSNQDYRKFYDRESKEIVIDFFAKDLELFGYDF